MLYIYNLTLAPIMRLAYRHILFCLFLFTERNVSVLQCSFWTCWKVRTSLDVLYFGFPIGEMVYTHTKRFLKITFQDLHCTLITMPAIQCYNRSLSLWSSVTSGRMKSKQERAWLNVRLCYSTLYQVPVS